MFRFALVAAVSVGLSGCGSSSSLDTFQTNFEGTWVGTLSSVVNGHSTSASFRFIIAPIDSSTVTVSSFCNDGIGPVGTSSSDTSFALGNIVCPVTLPVFDQDGCFAFTTNLKGGTGELSGGTLTLSLEGTTTGCRQTSAFTSVFTGTK
ncbi:MAG: hypothetical protein ACLPM8_10085 [Myxococcaceae bacterium]